MQRTWRCWRTVFGSIVFVVIALSAANTAPVAGALLLRACDLLTLTDVAGVLGGGFSQREDVALTGGPTQSNCAYHASGSSVVISLQQISYDSAQYLNSEQAGIAQQKGVTVTPVGGLGQSAFYFLGPNPRGAPGLFQLHFGKGKQLVTLWVATGGKPNIGAAQALATIVYSRLQ